MKSTDDLTDKYFKIICECELEIENLNNRIAELEDERSDYEERLSNATVVYSKLNTK